MTTRVDLSGRGHSAVEESCRNGCPTSGGSFCGVCISMGMLASSRPRCMGWMVSEAPIIMDLDKIWNVWK